LVAAQQMGRGEVPGGAKKHPEHSHTSCSTVVEMNQQKSMYVTSKHLRICLGILV